MFLCESCHPQECKLQDIEPESYGRCESCGGTRLCTDCKDHHRPGATKEKS